MGKIVKIRDVRIPLYFCRFCAVHTGLEITQATANSAKSALYLFAIALSFFNSCKAGSSTLSERIT